MIDTTGFNPNIGKKLSAVYGGSRVSHAVLISGGSPELRKLIAEYASKVIVCRGGGVKPCGKCEACRKAEAGVDPDIIVFEKIRDKRYFTKKSVQELCTNVYLTPNESPVKVYILSELQDMTEESQNLLLKILEEPPSYTAFILTASSRNVLLPTVLSRVADIDLGEDGYIEDKTSNAGDIACRIADAILAPNEYDIIKASALLVDSKRLFEDVLCELVMIFRGALVLSAGGEGVYSAQAGRLASSLSKKQLLNLYDAVNDLLSGIEKNKNQNLLLTSLSASLRQAVQL